MREAIQLARLGEGRVEPNPMVGCVIVRNGEVLAKGAHQRYGGPHAEIEAINELLTKFPALEQDDISDATFYVTLEPCCHHGKTPPCTEAILQVKPKRVVVGLIDPFPKVHGGGVAALKAAGITVETGVLKDECRQLVAPYLTRVTQHRPWVIAKWAMTLDGRIATRTKNSQWISNPTSRERVQRLRSRVDGILVGVGTARDDNPQLVPRLPEGETPLREPLRIVLDDRLEIPIDLTLVTTSSQTPTLIACTSMADDSKKRALESKGCQVVVCDGDDRQARFANLLKHMAENGVTNLLVEGGSSVLGLLQDGGYMDEVYVFLAPKLIGGSNALSPVGGLGIEQVAMATTFDVCSWETLGTDLMFHGQRRLEQAPLGHSDSY